MMSTDRQPSRCEPPQPYDVVIVGAGLAGLSLAAGLARAHRRVLVVAASATHPREFRAEKLAEPEMVTLDRLGLGVAARAATTPLRGVVEARWGRVILRKAQLEFAMVYPDLVDALRQAIPPEVDVTMDRVTGLVTGADMQQVTFADGRRVDARLLVVATGMNEMVSRWLGLQRRPLADPPTLVFGFDVAPDGFRMSEDHLVWHGERSLDGIAYMTMFRLGEGVRANFFTFFERDSDAARAIAADPAGELRRLMPKLIGYCGAIVPTSRIDVRAVGLSRIDDPRRDGVVIIGDAFSVSCPSVGRGTRKAITDVDVLTRRIPAWLATPGMSRAKTDTFYGDPQRVAIDTLTVEQSVRVRRLLTGRDLGARLLRLRRFVYHRTRFELLVLARRLLRRDRLQIGALPEPLDIGALPAVLDIEVPPVLRDIGTSPDFSDKALP